MGAYEFVGVANPLASMSKRCRDKLSVTMQNSRSVSLLCDISTMSPGEMGGSSEFAASIQLLGMWLSMALIIESQRLVLKDMPVLSYLFA